MTHYLCDTSFKLNGTGTDHYKTILDVLYMTGTFLGGKFFGHIGELHGRRFSLGAAIFTTLLGTSLGLFRKLW